MVSGGMAPYSKTGGLGEAVGGLSRELAARGHRITCVLPSIREWGRGMAFQLLISVVVNCSQFLGVP
jgi:glycogen synthase